MDAGSDELKGEEQGSEAGDVSDSEVAPEAAGLIEKANFNDTVTSTDST